MHCISQFITNAKAHARNGNPVFCPCKDCMNQRKWAQIESVRMHLITRGFILNYTTWTMYGEVGVNVPQKNDDVAMTDIAFHEAVTNKEPMATINDVFMNTLADDTEHDDGISQLVCNVESRFFSDRQLRKLEKIRQDGKTPLYKNCPMSKLEADIMLLEFKSTNRLSDKGFDQLLGIIRKILPEKK